MLRARLNRIAFVDLHGRVCTIDPDGRSPRCLSENGIRFQFPVWSPDGRQIAAIGASPGGSGVYSFGVGRGLGLLRTIGMTELYYGQVQAPLYLSWSPDSSRLGFLVSYPQGIGLYLAPCDGRHESRLIETGQPFFWDWMPDSAYLLIHTGGMGAQARLNFIDQDGEDWGQDLAHPGYFQAPAISDNGRYWAFAQRDERGQSHLVVEHHVSGDRVGVPHEGAIAFAWQPGEERLAFISPEESARHFFGPLNLLEMPGGRITCLMDQQVLAFFWSPGGRYLAAFTLATMLMRDVFTLDVWLIDTRHGTRRKLTTFLPPPYFVNEFLPIFDQYARSHRLWSAAGDTLLLPFLDGSVPSIALLDLDGNVTLLAEGTMPSWSHK